MSIQLDDVRAQNSQRQEVTLQIAILYNQSFIFKAHSGRVLSGRAFRGTLGRPHRGRLSLRSVARSSLARSDGDTVAARDSTGPAPHSPGHPPEVSKGELQIEATIALIGLRSVSGG